MSSQAIVNDPSCPATDSPRQRSRALKRQESLLRIGSIPTTLRSMANVDQYKSPTQHVPPTSRIPLEKVQKSKELWFKDGDVIFWIEDGRDSLLFRVHRHVLKESQVEPFCTVVDCDYPNPERPDEMFLDGVWVIKYDGRNPTEFAYVIKWMYERPSVSKRSTIPFAALEAYLKRAHEDFVPAMRRCALEYLWNMLPTSLNYHQRVPTLIEDCYSEDPILFYKPHVLLRLVKLARDYKLIAMLPLLYYYIAQWPVGWITDGVPAASMGCDLPFDDPASPLPTDLAFTILAGREELRRMRESRVFNFMEAFTLSGTAVDIPVEGCDREKREETGETCFQWLMRVWFYMRRFGFIACPNALDIMNMGQWAELKKHCCEGCAKRAIEHMLIGRDGVWDALPSLFRLRDWTDVLERQKKEEASFEGPIS